MRSLFALLLTLSSTLGAAAPFAVQVGETKLALDTPPGFADVQATGSPRLLELGEALTAASNKILLFALEDSDVRRFNVGDSPELRRYVIIVTPRDLQTARVNTAASARGIRPACRTRCTLPLPGLRRRASESDRSST